MEAAAAGDKRTAAAAGLDTAQVAARPRLSRAVASDSFGGLAEHALAGEHDPKLAALLKEQLLSRAWWEKWATATLFAWLWDFAPSKRQPGLSFSDASDRERLLQFLVEGGVPRPKEGAEEEQFNLAWLRVNGHVKTGKVAKGAPAPPRIFFAAASSAAAAAAAQAGGGEPQAARPAEEGKRQEGKRPEAPKAAAAGLAPLAIGSPPQLRQQRQRSPSPQRAVSPELMEDLAPYDGDPGGSSEDAESIPEMVRPSHIVLPLPVGPGRNREGRKMPDAVRGAFPTPARLCRTCLVPAPDPHRMEWICECGLRGDKEAGEACNRLLAARMERQAAARRDPGDLPSSSGANAGQSYAQSTAASRLERELKHLARGTPHPLFVGPDASAPVSGREALAIVRKALGASATENPSEELEALISCGLLMHPGYCVPRLLSKAGSSASSLLLADGAEIPIQSSGTGPPPVLSVQAFLRACVNVIFPLLVGKPAALVQWFALVASVLELEDKRGWAPANTYLTQLLQERVSQRREFAEPSQACIAALLYAPTASTASGSSVSSNQKGATRPGSADSPYCDSWNWQGGCAAGAGCTKLHQCQYGGRGCTNTTQHRSPECPSRWYGGSAPRHEGSSRGGHRGGRGGGGYRGGGKGGGGSNSSVSTSKPATQA